MDIYDKRLLSNVQRFNAHYDLKSKEISTNIKKPKYKLAGQIVPELNSYPFFVLTREKEACQGFLRFCIKRGDWLRREKGYLTANRSYTDLNNKVEVLSPEEVLVKIKDRDNMFKKVAKLCKRKCIELQNLIKKIDDSKKPVLPETREVVALGLLDKDNPLLKKMGIL